MKKTIVMNVEGMHCAGCENRINNAVKTLKGVKSVKASHINKNVVIVANDKVSEEDIKNAVKNIGFDVI